MVHRNLSIGKGAFIPFGIWSWLDNSWMELSNSTITIDCFYLDRVGTYNAWSSRKFGKMVGFYILHHPSRERSKDTMERPVTCILCKDSRKVSSQFQNHSKLQSYLDISTTGTWSPIHIKGLAIGILHAGLIFWTMGNPKKVVWTISAIEVRTHFQVLL